MATAAEKETFNLKLVRVFAHAGLLDENDWEKFEEKHTKYKDLIEVLNRQFSLETLGDFVFRTDMNPFSRPAKGKPSLSEQMVGELNFQRNELAWMLGRHKPNIDELIHLLEKSHAIKPGTMKTAIETAKKEKAEAFPWLVHNDLLDMHVIERYMNAPENPLPRLCSMFIAISVLESNGLMTNTAFRKLTKKMSSAGMEFDLDFENILDEVNKTIRLDSAKLLEAIDAGLNLPMFNPSESPVDMAAVDMFPPDFLRRRMILPFFKEGQRIGIAMTDPLDTGLAMTVRWICGRWVHPHFAPPEMIATQLAEVFGAEGPPVVSEDGTERPLRVGSSAEKSKGLASGIRKEVAENQAVMPVMTVRDLSLGMKAPDVQVDTMSAAELVSSVLESAIELNATDIHFECARSHMGVRFRIDGVLTKILNVPEHLIGPVISRIKILANMDVTERRRPQDGHITLELEDRHFDFRIATLLTAHGEKVAIRILDSARVMNGIDEIGFNPEQLDQLKRIIHNPHGLVLVTGPTGSGKTSTLYACLNELNHDTRHLVTIEDPIEYQLEGVNQIQVEPTIGLGFSEGLRAILRQDPNIIMVGEIRDPDTAKTAIRAALTGHLVLSTMHTNTCIDAFQALINLDATSYMIGSAVIAVVSQRLVRRLCDECKKKVPVERALAEQLGVKYSAKLQWNRAQGCPECLGTGYHGRLGIFEVLEMTPELRTAVLDNQSPDELADMLGERLTLREHGMEKIREGVTSPEEIIEKAILG